MKTFGFVILGLAALLLAMPVLLLDVDLGTAKVYAKDKKDDEKKDDEKKDGEKKKPKSKFGTDEEEEEAEGEVPDKPVPKTYVLSDYRLEFELKDSRFWKQDKRYDDKEVERGVCLKLQLKRPKSDDPFDVLIQCQGTEHKMQFKYPDGTVIGAENIKGMSDKDYEREIAEWKEVKDKTKPKSVKLSRDVGKAVFYSFTGMTPGGSFPLHRQMYYFKYKDKTYMMSVLFTTTSYKNKEIRELVDKMMKSFKAKKKKR